MFELVYDQWMPPGMFILHGEGQFVVYKNGKVKVFTDREMQEIAWEAYQKVIHESTPKYGKQDSDPSALEIHVR